MYIRWLAKDSENFYKQKLVPDPAPSKGKNNNSADGAELLQCCP